MQGSVRYTVFESSGALRVENPEEIRDLAALEIRPSKSGYLHVYIANTSARAVNWDELAITRLRGQVLEINHYYPYGLQLFGIDNEGRSYPYKYGGKELQQDAWARQMVLGGDFINLDWLDFEARMYDPTIARWYNPDPAEQFMNPYLAMGNSPTVYVDPDGQLAWFVPVIVGAVLGSTAGGVVAHNNGQDWWKGAITGGIIGAGIGLGVSAGLSAAGANITGLGGVGTTSGMGTFGASGASSFGWNITSNSLITANINIASTAMQGGDWDAVYKSGLVGLGAGAIGGLAGSLKMNGAQGAAYGRTTSAFGLKASKTQNIVANVLNGGVDRYVKGIDAGLAHRDALANSFWGGVEGLISASLVNKSNYLDGLGVENIGLTAPGLNRFNGRLNYQFFRYASSGISSAITSTPGAGFFAGRTFLSVYAPFNVDPLMTVVTPWLSFGRFGFFPGFQRMTVGGPDDNYPYASPFLSPYSGQQ